MARRGNYKTKHYDQLSNLMKANSSNHLTVPEIQAYLAEIGVSIGTATLYRNLERMIEEGLIVKYTVSPDSPACFEYVEAGCQHDTCYHGKCEVCGKIIHLHCHEVEHINQHMAEEHHFTIDWKRTVFYGICEDCQKTESV